MTDFVSRIDEVLVKKNLKRAALCDDLGLSATSITDWARRGTIPAGDICLKIAKYLGVSVEWLVTGEEQALSAEDAELGRGVREAWGGMSARERAAADAVFGGFFSARGLAA